MPDRPPARLHSCMNKSTVKVINVRFSFGVDRPPLKVTAATSAAVDAAVERDDLMRRHASLTPGLFFLFFPSFFSVLFWVNQVIHCERGTARHSTASPCAFIIDTHKTALLFYFFFFFFHNATSQIDVTR